MEDLLREKLISVFPTMDHQEVDKVINGLLLLGLETEDDLKYLKEQDLTTLLPPIKSRRFLSVCQPVELLQTIAPSSLSLLSPEPSNLSMGTSSDWAQSFIVNWEKFPSDFLKDLNNKQKPTESHIRQMVGLLMSDVFLFDSRPSRQNLRIIAQKVVSRFPDAFVDEINGRVISNGVETLMFQMESRKENVNRNVTFLSSTPNIVTKKMKLNVHSIENWEPNLSSESVELINIKEQLQQTYRVLPWNTNDVKKCMSATYSLQRQTINAVVPFAEVLIQWPFLSQIEYLLDHFATLMNFSLMERLYSTISTKSRLIYSFFSNKCSKGLVKQVLLEATVIGTENKGIQRVGLAWLPLLIAYFGDKVDHLILSVNHLAAIPEIEEICPTSHPIIVVKGTWFDSEDFYVLVEKKVYYTFTDALQAVGALFAVHYVMNMQYHPNVFATLEFIQRYMVDYNPNKVKRNAKGKKKRALICPRIVTLIRELNSFGLTSI